MSRFDRSSTATITAATTTTTTDKEELDREADHIADTVVRTESEEETARRMLQLLRAGADVRARKVRRLRAAVRVKAYENQLKLTIAVDRMVSRTLDDAAESAA